MSDNWLSPGIRNPDSVKRHIDAFGVATGAYPGSNVAPAGYTLDKTYADRKSGFDAKTFAKGDEKMFGISGTEEAKDFPANLDLMIEQVKSQAFTDMFEEAAKYAEETRKTIYLSGHSGGVIASVMADRLINRGHRAEVVLINNPPALSYINRAREDIGDTPLTKEKAEQDLDITNYKTKGDLVSELGGEDVGDVIVIDQKVDAPFSFFGPHSMDIANQNAALGALETSQLGEVDKNQTIMDIAGYLAPAANWGMKAWDSIDGFVGGEAIDRRRAEIADQVKSALQGLGVDIPNDQYINSAVKAVDENITRMRVTGNIYSGLSAQEVANALAGAIGREIAFSESPKGNGSMSAKANKLTTDVFGQLGMPRDGATTAAPTTATPASTTVQLHKARNLLTRPNEITIKSGDTLSQIAVDNGTTVKALMAVNPHITNADEIKAGSRLSRPDGAAPAQPQRFRGLPPRKPTPPGVAQNSIVEGARRISSEMLGPAQEFKAKVKAIATGQPMTPPAATQVTPSRDTITVEDANLTNFAKRHGTNWRAVFDENKDQLSNPNFVTAGMSLRVPNRASQAPSQAATQTSAEAHAQVTQEAARKVQAVTNDRLAAQAKGDAAETTTKKAEAKALAKTVSDVYGPPSLAQYTAQKQNTPAKKTTLGGYGRSLLDGTAPDFEPTPAVHSLRNFRTNTSAKDGGSNTNNGVGTSANDRLANMSKTFSNMSLHAQIDAARAARRRAARAETVGVGNLNRSGHLTSIGTLNANGKTESTSVNPNQKNRARNKDGTYSVDADGNGTGDAGGTVICTELRAQGLLPHDVYRADQRFGFRMIRDDPYVISGYHFWAKPVVKLMRKSKLFTHILNKTVAEAWAKEMVVREGLNGVGTLRGRVLFAIGLPICRTIGRILAAREGREGKVV